MSLSKGSIAAAAATTDVSGSACRYSRAAAEPAFDVLALELTLRLR
jgi:hypothetical protein